jgi:hypothetical protein
MKSRVESRESRVKSGSYCSSGLGGHKGRPYIAISSRAGGDGKPSPYKL